MQRFYFLCLLFLLPPPGASGEDRILHIPASSLSWFNPVTNTDSLEALLIKTGGTEKVDLLCELAYAYQKSGTYTTGHQKILAEALELSRKLNYNNGMVKAHITCCRSINMQRRKTCLKDCSRCLKRKRILTAKPTGR